MNSNELIKMARAGDKAAFARLYAECSDALYRYAYFRLGNKPDAEDAVSNCVIEAYRSIGTLRDAKAFKGWIFKILYRECCEILRQRIRSRSDESIDDLQLADETELSLAPELKEALGILAEDEREIVLLSTVARYNSREIAEMLGMKHSTVRSKLSRALAKMRTFLE